MYSYVLFDLDGTLTDPQEGICKSFQYALHAFGVEEETENLHKVIGPPLVDSFRDYYGFSTEKALAAVAKYRERFSTIGIKENVVYPGILELLRYLSSQGRTLCLATSKPLIYARRILESFSLDSYFSVMVGSELDGTRNYKDEVIGEVLRQLGDPPRNEVLMIGDRHQDVEGAKAWQIASLGVGYGFAEVGELEMAGADYFADSVEDLTAMFRDGCL